MARRKYRKQRVLRKQDRNKREIGLFAQPILRRALLLYLIKTYVDRCTILNETYCDKNNCTLRIGFLAAKLSQSESFRGKTSLILNSV